IRPMFAASASLLSGFCGVSFTSKVPLAWLVMIGAFGSELTVFGFVCGDNAGTMSTDRLTMKSGRHIALDKRVLIGKSVYMNWHLVWLSRGKHCFVRTP